ncbi:hypothetical protein AMELA_G00060780 [Ameiurus melas]|uniref:CARD domain-containing protein n=1 Tax=Ameiurus melas TaxID=219545 RepID=A0A7J6B5F5_AMEME|nr:hypothetical protein AMELA_G00060780 [Ameiurus melas]
MGSQTSRPADQQPLLDHTDEVPLIEKISIVVMGPHGVGKNTVGNAILKKKAFTFQDSFKNYYLKEENTTFDRHVSVIRVPGWQKCTNSIELMPLTSEETLLSSEALQANEVYRGVQFLKKNRKELIERIVAVKPIADELFQFIDPYKYEKILQAPSEYEQRRQLYDIMDKGGKKLQFEFYKCLLKHEKYLVEDLEESP